MKSQKLWIVVFSLRVFWWAIPRMLVIIAIGVGVTWGGMFHQPWRWFEGVVSWAMVWAAIDYYRWHTNRYETQQPIAICKEY